MNNATPGRPPPTVTIASRALRAEIAPLGAEMQRLTGREGRDLQWSGNPAVWRRRAPILFPVIGLLVGGHYRLHGTAYPMPKHGFARDSLFEVVEQTSDAITLRLCDSDATRAIYPFAFTLDIAFGLSGAALCVIAAIANRSDAPMPASLGFHPALRWPLPFGHARGEHRLRFGHPEPAPVRRINANGFLTPTAQPSPVEGDTLRLRDALFVDDALIFDRLVSRELVYGAPFGPQIRVRFDDFPTLGVWTKPGAGFLCIEPRQGFADPVGYAGDIFDKPGIVALAPGETRRFTMRIALEGA